HGAVEGALVVEASSPDACGYPLGSLRRVFDALAGELLTASEAETEEVLERAAPLSLELVRHVARRVRPEGGRRPAPILVVAAYRDEGETAARGHVRAAVVTLRSKGLAREIALNPLAP